MKLPNLFARSDARPSYSWEGEDVVAGKIMRDVFCLEKGRFVDIGAHHPTQMSNTYAFYQRGWRGINIDATPGSMAAFESERPEDINLEMAISSTPGEKEFHLFEESTLNGFLSPEEVAYHGSRGVAHKGSVFIPCE